MRPGTRLTVATVRFAVAIAALVAVAGGACTKAPPEAHSAPAANAKEGGKAKTGDSGDKAPAGKTAAADDSTPPPGIDLSKLDELGKKTFFRVVTTEPSICGKAESLLVSAKAKGDAACRRSYNAVRYVARLADHGYTQSEIAEAIEKRYRKADVKTIDVSQAPAEGSAAAKVTLVEFADYECPHCKRLQPVLRQILDEFRGEVRLYFKHYPLPQHTNARLAAEAAVAAQKQGKFWPFQEKLWENQDSLSPADMEKFAKDIGLDMAKFRSDFDDVKTKARVQKDRDDGSTLKLQSTPALYVNGREYTDAKDTESLREWIKEELGR
jgi:protein-disulfide isomerase